MAYVPWSGTGSKEILPHLAYESKIKNDLETRKKIFCAREWGGGEG